ncbi:unnamed protein product [Phaedon cochleariae]|uniref:Peptidase S1 domain-containing protein n=1 Tax=Phaedon cochleariae TaxID=80249 RepID=A0A9P0DI86_PHACE|nr:unnamed protein product [Phaedon cochleariae]
MHFLSNCLLLSILYTSTSAFLLTSRQFNDVRIVGGKEANISSFPYQISLMKYGSHVCGGAIFHDSYILTAAHCVINGLAKSYSIRAGSSFRMSGGTVFKVCSVHIHEKFVTSTMDYDIAILTLCSPILFSSTMLPAALPLSSESLSPGILATVTGWGYTTESGSVSNNLQQVQVPIVNHNQCSKIFTKETISNNMICAGFLGKGGKDACQGDSGGPMIAKGKLYGIVSWGYGCAQSQYPGIYTNVPVLRNWIKQITKY